MIHEATLFGKQVIVKERFVKAYRHPNLDEKINTKRVREEARVLVRARQFGVDVPTLLHVDRINRLIWMERISGASMKSWLYWKSGDETNKDRIDVSEDVLKEMDKVEVTLDDLATKTGQTIAKLHKAAIIHGDLTTSNFILRDSNMSLVMIDFGLSYNSTLTEDRAVDLYVLERAFLSTHTDMSYLVRTLPSEIRMKRPEPQQSCMAGEVAETSSSLYHLSPLSRHRRDLTSTFLLIPLTVPKDS